MRSICAKKARRIPIIPIRAFVDIGVHQDGLVHISQLADRYVKDPNEIVKVQEQIEVRVVEIDLERKRIALSMRSEESAEEKTARVERAKEGGKNTAKKEGAKARPQKKKPQKREQKAAPPSKPDTAFGDVLRQAGLKRK